MKSAKRFLRMSLAWAAIMGVLFFLPALWDKAGRGGLWAGRIIALALEAFLNALLNATFPKVDVMAPRFPKGFGSFFGAASLVLSAVFLYLPFPTPARAWFESALFLLLCALASAFFFQIFRKRRTNALWSLSSLSAHAFLSISLMGWVFVPGLWMENAGWEEGALMIIGILGELLLFGLGFLLVVESVKEDPLLAPPGGRAPAFAPALFIPVALGALIPALFCALGI
ncbi:MAG: hypothetical protein IKS61_01995 [Aeriscardovia sp.]|nr:hypothetical protein [Aeriscardovia sp.]